MEKMRRFEMVFASSQDKQAPTGKSTLQDKDPVKTAPIKEKSGMWLPPILLATCSMNCLSHCFVDRSI